MIEILVCDGRFGDALQCILDRYLANLGTPKQESAWVSGFFGSGKSHLLKMLTHLWVDTGFPDGVTARGLVRGGLPDELRAQLRELDTQRASGEAASRGGRRHHARGQRRSRPAHRAVDSAPRPWLGPRGTLRRASATSSASGCATAGRAARVAVALRGVLVEGHQKLTGAIEAARGTLAGDATWDKLDATAQDEIRRRLGLDALFSPAAATEEDLLRALEARALAAWRSEIVR